MSSPSATTTSAPKKRGRPSKKVTSPSAGNAEPSSVAVRKRRATAKSSTATENENTQMEVEQTDTKTTTRPTKKTARLQDTFADGGSDYDDDEDDDQYQIGDDSVTPITCPGVKEIPLCPRIDFVEAGNPNKSYAYISKMSEWDEHSNACCIWDGEPFEGVPIFIPFRYSEKLQRMYVTHLPKEINLTYLLGIVPKMSCVAHSTVPRHTFIARDLVPVICSPSGNAFAYSYN